VKPVLRDLKVRPEQRVLKVK
jgi:hypothetical protein